MPGIVVSQPAVSGMAFPATVPNAAVSHGTGVLNSRIYAHRVYGSGTISKIRILVGVQSGNICVGVYAAPASSGLASAAPGALVATSGSVACPAAGRADVALTASVAVTEGMWFAIMADNNTATFGNVGSGSVNSIYEGFSGFTTTAGTTLPLPTPLTLVTFEAKVYHLLGVV